MGRKRREVHLSKPALVGPDFGPDSSVPAAGSGSVHVYALSRRFREGCGKTAYARADVVFLGDALAMRNTFLGNLQQREVTFSVRDRWKGSTSGTTLVRTNIGEIACGYNFKKRNSYLMFAYWDQQRQHLTTSFCDLTRTEAKAKGAIGALDRLTKRANAAAKNETDHKIL